ECVSARRCLHSFPTRRSSDLDDRAGAAAPVRTWAIVIISIAIAGAASSCGSGGGDRLDVFAASSLVSAFPAYAQRFHGRSPAYSDRKSTRLNSSDEWIAYAVF